MQTLTQKELERIRDLHGQQYPSRRIAQRLHLKKDTVLAAMMTMGLRDHPDSRDHNPREEAKCREIDLNAGVWSLSRHFPPEVVAERLGTTIEDAKRRYAKMPKGWHRELHIAEMTQ